jgi:hypothetical protein
MNRPVDVLGSFSGLPMARIGTFAVQCSIMGLFYKTLADNPGAVSVEQENSKVLTRRGQGHVFGQQFLESRELSSRKMDQSPDFAALLVGGNSAIAAAKSDQSLRPACAKKTREKVPPDGVSQAKFYVDQNGSACVLKIAIPRRGFLGWLRYLAGRFEGMSQTFVSAGEFVDRRNPVAVERMAMCERRQFANSHDDLSPEAAELARAIDQYKLHHRRRFITFEEMLAVVTSLGYHR